MTSRRPWSITAPGLVNLYDDALPFERRMGPLNLAGLLHRGHGEPQKDGGGATYARRYALFTLAGIAGEDDLDAPDLNAPEPGSASAEQPPGV